MKKAVIYARYSSSSQNEQSIETQLDACNNYAKENNLSVIKHYIDKGMTGTNANRPGFQEMIRDARKHLFSVVIVYKLDRFARDEYDDIYYEKLLNDNNIKRVSATETLPEDVFSNKLIKAITRLNNENYSRVLSERVNAGLNKNVEKGLMVGGSVTYGYDMVDKKYVINEKQADVIRLIFKLYTENKTGKEIINELNKRGMYNKNGKSFLNQHIFKILRNRRYIGYFSYKNVEYANFIPPVIDLNTFNKVQYRLKHNKNIHGNRSKTNYLLSSKLFCAHCNNRLSGSAGRGRHGKLFNYYRCTSCKYTVRKDKIENAIIDATINDIIKNDKLDNWITIAVTLYNSRIKKPNKDIDRIKNQIASITKQINNILKAIKMGIITESTKSELENLEERRRILINERSKKLINKPNILTFDKVKNWFLRFDTNKPNEDDKKDIIDMLISKVTYDGHNVLIDYNIIDQHILKKV